eukprot:m51a1_g14139 hypothetical protein (381) ;mRNA; f:243020-244437
MEDEEQALSQEPSAAVRERGYRVPPESLQVFLDGKTTDDTDTSNVYRLLVWCAQVRMLPPRHTVERALAALLHADPLASPPPSGASASSASSGASASSGSAGSALVCSAFESLLLLARVLPAESLAPKLLPLAPWDFACTALAHLAEHPSSTAAYTVLRLYDLVLERESTHLAEQTASLMIDSERRLVLAACAAAALPCASRPPAAVALVLSLMGRVALAHDPRKAADDLVRVLGDAQPADLVRVLAECPGTEWKALLADQLLSPRRDFAGLGPDARSRAQREPLTRAKLATKWLRLRPAKDATPDAGRLLAALVYAAAAAAAPEDALESGQQAQAASKSAHGFVQGIACVAGDDGRVAAGMAVRAVLSRDASTEMQTND